MEDSDLAEYNKNQNKSEEKGTKRAGYRRKNTPRASKIAWLEEENTEKTKSRIEVDNLLTLLNEFEAESANQISTENHDAKSDKSESRNSLILTTTEQSNRNSIEDSTALSKDIEDNTEKLSAERRADSIISEANSEKMMNELDNIIDFHEITGTNDKLPNKKELNFDPLEGPPYKCAGCFELIDDEACKTEFSYWHPEHFSCVNCGKSLADETFFEVDYELFCETDFELRFLNKCKNCHEYIREEIINVNNNYYHPEHFKCAECGKLLNDTKYFAHNGNVYCVECYEKSYAPKCKKCGNSVMSNFMKALGATWHTQCFSCKVCQSVFSGGNFHIYENEPFCEIHYHEIRGSICFGCKKPIVGSFVTACERKFHPEHFLCFYCKKTLTGTSYKEFQGKPYCTQCCSNFT